MIAKAPAVAIVVVGQQRRWWWWWLGGSTKQRSKCKLARPPRTMAMTCGLAPVDGGGLNGALSGLGCPGCPGPPGPCS